MFVLIYSMLPCSIQLELAKWFFSSSSLNGNENYKIIHKSFLIYRQKVKIGLHGQGSNHRTTHVIHQSKNLVISPWTPIFHTTMLHLGKRHGLLSSRQTTLSYTDNQIKCFYLWRFFLSNSKCGNRLYSGIVKQRSKW